MLSQVVLNGVGSYFYQCVKATNTLCYAIEFGN